MCLWEAKFFTYQTDMECHKQFIYLASINGFYFYRKTWQPVEGESLHYGYQKNTPFDVLAKKTTDKNGMTVRYFQMEYL